MPKLCHASNIIRKYGDRKTTSKQKAALDAIVVEYKKYITHVLNITTYDEQSIREKVDCLNTYYNFIHNAGYDNTFSSQGKFRPTILEEFMYLLFKDILSEKKTAYDKYDTLASGSVKAYSNLFFKPSSFESFVKKPEIGINEKDQDYAIYRTFKLSIDGKGEKTVRVPAVAIEVKTYIDKTMLDSIIATAEKLKSGNPYTLFIAVSEWYDVSTDVDPSYSRIDQIYVLRKGKHKSTWNNIDSNIVLSVFNSIQKHLERPWSDVKRRLEEDGVII